MLLSDTDILGEIYAGSLSISPLDPEDVQPASVDVHLGSDFHLFKRDRTGSIDPLNLRDDLTDFVSLSSHHQLPLLPGDFMLASTQETVQLPGHLAARLEGVSSLGRLGLVVHSTAGFIDPGFVGEITLELSNFTRIPIELRPGMRIGQICFIRMSSPVSRGYGERGRYQHQAGPTLSRHRKGN